VPWVLTMIDVKKDTAKNGSTQTNVEAGKSVYTTHCMSCHGANREGGNNYPSLRGINKNYDDSTFIGLLNSGRRMMPAFKELSDGEKNALASFILDIKDKQGKPFVKDAKKEDPYRTMPYTATGYNKFLTREGYPAVKPPWGTLTAIDLNSGNVIWKDVLGDYPLFKAKGIHTGTENYGGSVVTAGGVLFIAATKDSKFRAFNKNNGKLLWEVDLPAPGFATPATYEVNGKQYIVIACGGGKLGTRSGGAYVAFALPEKK